MKHEDTWWFIRKNGKLLLAAEICNARLFFTTRRDARAFVKMFDLEKVEIIKAIIYEHEGSKNS